MPDELVFIIAVYKNRKGAEFFVLARTRADAQAKVDCEITIELYPGLSFDREITVAEARELGVCLIDHGLQVFEEMPSLDGYILRDFLMPSSAPGAAI